jgi:hypothetical protein
MTMKRLLTLLAAMSLVCVLALATPQARAATTNNLTPIGMGYGDSIWNFDFTQVPGSYLHVDWAVSLLFYNNAEIDKVKNIADGKYWFYGSTQHAYMDDGSGGSYDADKGKKTDTPSCLGSTRHYRIYAPTSTDRMYNPSFGYYVFATSHYDHHELCNASFNDSEGTEHDLYNLFNGKGYASYYDWAWFYNPEQNRVEGDHHWNNDGYATYIRIT